jgi:hypothetical protein
MPPKRKAHLAKADSNVSQAKKAAKGSKSAKPAASKEKLSNASAEPSDEKAKVLSSLGPHTHMEILTIPNSLQWTITFFSSI